MRFKAEVRRLADHENLSFNYVWKREILKRFIERVASSSYGENFILKGAICLSHQIDLHRETQDLDFLVRNLETNIDAVHEYLQHICAVSIADGFEFQLLAVDLLNHNHMKYPGYTISVLAILGHTKTKIFIDIGVGDVVEPVVIVINNSNWCD